MGEPDFGTPPEIVAAAVDALHGGHTRYTEPAGDRELRAALAAVVTRTAGAAYGYEQILVTHGSSAGLAAAILAVVNPGDRVVIPEPSYSLYADLVELAGARPVFVPLLPDYHLDLPALAAALDGARLLVLCTPGNPTGAVYRAAEWTRLGELIAASSAYVLSDEAYYALVYDGLPFVSGLAIEALRERLIYAQTFSKAYAMTGWRLGYGIMPADIAKTVALIGQNNYSCTTTFVQEAGIAALEGPDDPVVAMVEEFRVRRDAIVAGLNSLPGITCRVPDGAFYAFPNVSGVTSDDRRLASFFLEEAYVAALAGRGFGQAGRGYMRFSYANSLTKIDAAIERMRAVLPRYSE
jgi:aspartate aminotransferase